MSTPIIRKARPGDESAIHEAHMRSVREVCIKDHGEAEVRGWGNRPLGNRWVGPIKEGHVWVVEQDGVIYGHGYLDIFEKGGETKAHICGLYLTPEVLGKGCGLKLSKLMLSKARELGAEIVTLQSSITAHEFYKKLGFKDSGPMERHEIGGQPVRSFPMTMKLNESLYFEF